MANKIEIETLKKTDAPNRKKASLRFALVDEVLKAIRCQFANIDILMLVCYLTYVLYRLTNRVWASANTFRGAESPYVEPKAQAIGSNYVVTCGTTKNEGVCFKALGKIGFGSTIELVSFDKSEVVTFNGKFVCGFRNGDCRTESRSDNTVGNPHGFIIHGIEVLKGNEKVTKVIDVEN
nr:hypothetical protein [Tanacetum cinerariifolium]